MMAFVRRRCVLYSLLSPRCTNIRLIELLRSGFPSREESGGIDINQRKSPWNPPLNLSSVSGLAYALSALPVPLTGFMHIEKCQFDMACILFRVQC